MAVNFVQKADGSVAFKNEVDGKEIARAVAKAFTEDVTILDNLGKALGKRKAATT